jgi:hypothetical protein
MKPLTLLGLGTLVLLAATVEARAITPQPATMQSDPWTGAYFGANVGIGALY